MKRFDLVSIPVLTTLSVVLNLAPCSAQVVRRGAAVSGVRASATTTSSSMTPAQRARLHANPDRKWQRSPHTVFGTIASMNGDTFVLKLRNGRSLQVDATAAIANDQFSAPLFVGKPVSVEGVVRSNAVFAANDVFRTDTLDGLPADH